MNRITTKAILPTMQSAISIGGGRGNSTRVKLDLYLSPSQVADLMAMQDEEIDLVMTVDRKIDDEGMYNPAGVA